MEGGVVQPSFLASLLTPRWCREENKYTKHTHTTHVRNGTHARTHACSASYAAFELGGKANSNEHARRCSESSYVLRRK